LAAASRHPYLPAPEQNTNTAPPPVVHPNPSLRAHVRTHAENRPGIYRMWARGGGGGRGPLLPSATRGALDGDRGELLYVGKSVRVRSRLLSYFRAPKGEKAAELIRTADHIDWDYVPNEFAALVQEMKLIQQARPRFNVRHKRKRIYAFVKVTREPAPRVVPVSRVADDDATYYGPFPRVRSLARTVRELCHALGLRDCPGPTPIVFDDQLEIFRGGRTPRCLRADLRSCLAPCCGRVSAADYARAVETARRFLEGRGAGPLGEMEATMAAAAERRDFEYAAILRDRLGRLRGFQDELVAFRGRVEDLSFVYRVPGFRGHDRLYLVRGGRIRAALDHPKNGRERARAATSVEAVFEAPDPGPSALTPDQAAEILLVAQWFRRNPGERRRTWAPERWLEEKRPATRPV